MADKELGDLTAASALSTADLFYIVQGGNSRKLTGAQMRTFIDGRETRQLITLGAQGSLHVSAVDQLVTLDGASVAATALLPARSIPICVTAYVISTLTGTLTSFDVGIAGEVDKFGATLPLAAGSNNVGVVPPFAVYADTDVVVTANGGTGSGNTDKIRLVAYYFEFVAPTA